MYVYDLSYLEMSINVDELEIGSLSVGQKVQITADAVADKNYVGTVTRVSMKGNSSGGTTTYPVTIRIDSIDGLPPGHERQRGDRGGRVHQRPLSCPTRPSSAAAMCW